MFHTSIGNVTSFISTTSLEKKRLEVDSEKPRIRSSRTSSTTLKPLPLQSNPLPLATPFSLNLRLSDRDFNTLEAVAKGDFAELSLFEQWALSEAFPKDIKPSQLYRYFVYLLGHQKDHPSLLSIAIKLKKMGLEGSLDLKKVGALANTVFAQQTPIIANGTQLAAPITAPHLDRLGSCLLGHIFSYIIDISPMFCVSRRIGSLVSHPGIIKIIRNSLIRTNPAIVRRVFSLKRFDILPQKYLA